MHIKYSVALFFFAHQDDEFGVFQRIMDECRRGTRVFCAYLTDGVAERSSSLRRNTESIATLTKLGVYNEDIFFAGRDLAIPDGSLVHYLEKASSWVYDCMLQRKCATIIYIPAWEGGHPDHDALHAIVVAVADKLGVIDNVRQFPLYNGFGCFGPLFRTLLPLPMNGAIEVENIPWINRILFLRLCMSYPSQLTTWIGLLPFVFFDYVFNGKQVLQRVSLERIKDRPHDGLLYYERRRFFTWKKMTKQLTAWLNTVTFTSSR